MMHPFPSRAFTILGLVLCLHGLSRSQQMFDYPGFKSLSPSMMGALPGGKMTGLSSPGMDGIIPEVNIMFESVNDSTYVLGAGDYLTLGLGNRMISLPVNPEGFIVLENIGPVRVGDSTLRAAKKILLEKITKVFKGELLFVTLGKAKKIQASIVGAVQVPGIYVLTASARITDLVFQAGGLSSNSNKRIQVISHKKDTSLYDLDGYYVRNDIEQNPYLKAGDLIRMEEVDYGKPTLQIRVNELIATVELKEGQSAYDVIVACNSIQKYKNWNRVLVFEAEKQVGSLSILEAKAYRPKTGQMLEVKSFKAQVFINGAVARPSAYDFNSNYTALDYISAAGILPITGKIREVRIINAEGESRTINTSVDRIAPGDHIIIPESKGSKARDYITLAASIASIVASITLTVITINSK